jgi:hypothetical protein
MAKHDSWRSARFVLAGYFAAACLMIGCAADGQEGYPNQEARIDDLPALTAKTTNPSDVLVTAVEIAFHDKEVCCGKNSALEDDIRAAEPASLKEVGDKLRGRHGVSDGRVFAITAEYVPADSVNADWVIVALQAKQPLLMKWNSHLYVVYGVNFGIFFDANGGRANSINKLFLLDPRYSDERRQVVFDRQTDDWTKVKVLLKLKAEVQ